MKNNWRKLVAAFCSISMLMTIPGVSAYASSPIYEDMVESYVELPVEEDAGDVLEENSAYEEPEIMAEAVVPSNEALTEIPEEATAYADLTEETVGVGSGTYRVGDNVKAKYDSHNGSIVLYSTVATGGMLYCGWLEDAGIDRSSVKSISVKPQSIIKLPERSIEYLADEEYLLFCDLDNLTDIDLKGFDTSNMIDMTNMFSGCRSLKTLDMSGLDTSNVERMGGMFGDCVSLTSVNMKNLNTKKVVSLRHMFYGCESLTTLDLGSFNTSKVVSMAGMFDECKNLTNIDLSGFNTSKVEEMFTMFRNCKKIKYLDLGSFDMSKVTNSKDMLVGCTALEILITPRNKVSKDECPFTYPMYDRNGTKYLVMPLNRKSMVLGKTKEIASSIFIDVRNPSHAYYNAIYWAVGKGITKGYSDGTFGINRACTRGEMVMFLWRYAGKPKPKSVSKSPFKDVSTSHTFYNAILWAYQKGITKGYSDGSFGVNRNVSRGESMMFLWRLKGKKEPKAVSVSPFKDVPKTHTFYKAILWGYQKNITTGYTSGQKAGTFGINENCTRGQIVTFLYRARAI